MIFRFLICLVLISFLSACSGPGYYVQAISGQWKLMHARQDVQSLLDDPATDSELKVHLKSADQIRAFAEETLDLPADGSYSSYVEIDGAAVVWNVIATEEFSLQPRKWCFLVAGCVPYRGFFKQEKAVDSAAHLHKNGMDVFVSPAIAYSSLGWFRDPLLSTMFSGSDIRLAAYLFHELAHQRLYIKGDGVFNEGYASFVEQAGIQAWLESSQRQDDLQQWRQLQSAGKDFTNLIGDVRKELAELYRSAETETTKRGQKAEILRAFKLSYEQLKTERWHGKGYYSAWFERPVNNARLALYNTYEGSRCAFQGLFDQAEGDLRKFHQLAEQKSRLQPEAREKWLTQTCLAVASVNNQ
jgi:predicted aminopeptidase